MASDVDKAHLDSERKKLLPPLMSYSFSDLQQDVCHMHRRNYLRSIQHSFFSFFLSLMLFHFYCICVCMRACRYVYYRRLWLDCRTSCLRYCVRIPAVARTTVNITLQCTLLSRTANNKPAECVERIYKQRIN